MPPAGITIYIHIQPPVQNRLIERLIQW